MAVIVAGPNTEAKITRRLSRMEKKFRRPGVVSGFKSVIVYLLFLKQKELKNVSRSAGFDRLLTVDCCLLVISGKVGRIH
jgi:hypothetical protein